MHASLAVEPAPYREASVAAAYDRLALPIQFDAPARDLVEFVGVRAGHTILDVGAGTGAVTVPAAHAAGATGLVVATDASAEMLRRLRSKGAYHAVVMEMPRAPFADASFDIAVAGFVVSHLADYRRALSEVARMLRAGGRVGLTAWVVAPTAPAKLWRKVAERFLDVAALDASFRAVIPHDELFSNPANLRAALADAGFGEIDVVSRDYRLACSVEDFLTMRESAVEGTIARRLAGDRWEGLRTAAREQFSRAFGQRVEYIRAVNLARGQVR